MQLNGERKAKRMLKGLFPWKRFEEMKFDSKDLTNDLKNSSSAMSTIHSSLSFRKNGRL